MGSNMLLLEYFCFPLGGVHKATPRVYQNCIYTTICQTCAQIAPLSFFFSFLFTSFGSEEFSCIQM